MTLWAIVPVKPLRRGKSRLSGVLTENERTLLNYAMLENTLRALTAVESIQQVLVVSRDPAALSLAREFNARTLQEDDENTDLNLALKRATVVAQMYSASSVLILPADLPLLEPSIVDEFIRKLVKPPMVVISPDRRGDGTNALLMSPAGLIDYEYGPGSFTKHLDQITRYNVRYEVVETFSIELDLDLPEDLETLQKMDKSILTAQSAGNMFRF
jgi:2-phospho-L-lactate guanylyltransferase